MKAPRNWARIVVWLVAILIAVYFSVARIGVRGSYLDGLLECLLFWAIFSLGRLAERDSKGGTP